VIPRNCTVCGRVIPDGEVAHLIKDTSEGSVSVRIECANHTDHEHAGSWHDKAKATRPEDP